MLLASFCTLLLMHSGASADWQSEEYRVKAGFIYRFILFAKWPAEPPEGNQVSGQEKITIGIIGDDPFLDYFSEVVGTTVHGNKVLAIKRFGAFSSRVDLTTCQILFISRSENKKLKKILASLFNQPVLTVSDIDNFCERGGMVSLITLRHRIRFEVNLPAVRQVGLQLSSNFLRAALRVIQKDPGKRNHD